MTASTEASRRSCSI